MAGITLLLVPLLGCVLLVLLHTYFGVHVLERGIIFVDLTLAQFISIGIAFSLFIGSENLQLFYAVLFAVVGAFVLSLARDIKKFVYIEAFIGTLYIFSLAATMLILDKTPHGLEELKNILNGNILWISEKDLVETGILYTVIGAFHLIFRKKFLALSYSSTGENSRIWEFLFFLSFALMLVNSIRIAGILQVFSFLIIPALIGKLFTQEVLKILIGGWITGITASIAGIVVSYKLDVSTASLIVVFLGATFFALLGAKMLGTGRKRVKQSG
jgi:zinc/manganese transport system permease protein